MASKLMVIFAVLVFAGFASALDCYTCNKDQCDMDQSHWLKVQDCGKTLSVNHVGACAKMVYKDAATAKQFTLRKCVQALKKPDGKAAYECTPSVDGATLVSCETCDSNWCNSAASVKISIVTLLGVVLMFLIK